MVIREKKSYLKLDSSIEHSLKLIKFMLPCIFSIFSHFPLVIDVYNNFMSKDDLGILLGYPEGKNKVWVELKG